MKKKILAIMVVFTTASVIGLTSIVMNPKPASAGRCGWKTVRCGDEYVICAGSGSHFCCNETCVPEE